MADNIMRFGVTELEQYPVCRCKSYCKQLVENDRLCIPCQKPDMECLDSVSVNVCIENFKVIKTILGYKLIIEAIKKYKIMYTADNKEQSVHSFHYQSSFCEFILLKDFCCSNRNESIKDVFVGIEDIIIKDYNCRCIDISLILIMYPIVTQDECGKYSHKNGEFFNNY